MLKNIGFCRYCDFLNNLNAHTIFQAFKIIYSCNTDFAYKNFTSNVLQTKGSKRESIRIYDININSVYITDNGHTKINKYENNQIGGAKKYKAEEVNVEDKS